MYAREKLAPSDFSEIASYYPNNFCGYTNIYVCFLYMCTFYILIGFYYTGLNLFSFPLHNIA